MLLQLLEWVDISKQPQKLVNKHAQQCYTMCWSSKGQADAQNKLICQTLSPFNKSNRIPATHPFIPQSVCQKMALLSFINMNRMNRLSSYKENRAPVICVPNTLTARTSVGFVISFIHRFFKMNIFSFFSVLQYLKSIFLFFKKKESEPSLQVNSYLMMCIIFLKFKILNI